VTETEDVGLAFEPAASEPTFRVDLNGFEGPLDFLLELARSQKVDLARISVLALADQYIEFIERARELRLELAADYLVMAAWLAFLKSRLLLPAPPSRAEPNPADLAEALASRLRRLEQIRRAAQRLMQIPQLGGEIFGRGLGETVAGTVAVNYETNLYDLLAAYARQRQRQALSRVRFKPRAVWSLADAHVALARLIGAAVEWTCLDEWLVKYCVEPGQRRTALASTFSATLELVREGKIELRQSGAFAPLFVRSLPAGAGGAVA